MSQIDVALNGLGFDLNLHRTPFWEILLILISQIRRVVTIETSWARVAPLLALHCSTLATSNQTPE